MIFGFDFLLDLGRVGYARPAFFNLWLRDLCFHSRRRESCGRLLNFRRRGNHEPVALHFSDRTRFHGRRRIDIRLPLEREALDRPARLRAERVVIGAVIVDDVVVYRDVGHVHGLVHESDVLRGSKNALAQDRFADVADVDKIVIGRSDIKDEIDVDANRLAFKDDPRAARRNRRPTDYAGAVTPGNPGWPPFQIGSGEPNPAVIGEFGPATVVISGPTEILVGNPRVTDIGVGPVTIHVRPPVRIAHRDLRPPTIAVALDVDPLAAAQVVVEKINRHLVSCRPGNNGHKQAGKHYRKQYSFHSVLRFVALDLRVAPIIHSRAATQTRSKRS